MHTSTRVIITPADDECRTCLNTSDVNSSLVGGLNCNKEDVVKSQINKVPTCAEEITREWILFVMRQHQMHTFGRRLSQVGLFNVEMAGISEGGSRSRDQIDKASVQKVKTVSQHVLSEAFNVIVEVPDPPEFEEEEEEEEEEAEEEEKKVLNKLVRY